MEIRELTVDPDNPVIRLCIEGARAEYEGRADEARTLYECAWQAASDDYEACIAAHYVARVRHSPQEILHWNQEALARAEAISDERVAPFYPSLYLSLGNAHEVLGDETMAQHYYALAAELGVKHHVRE